MNEARSNSIPNTDHSSDEDEFASLSQDEKTAFEKIMAEIAAAETAAAAPAKSSSKLDQSPDPVLPHTDDIAAESDQEAIKSEQNQPPDLKVTAEATQNQSEISRESQGPVDQDQQETLNQHTAENDREEASTAQMNQDPSLSNDQQAALDQILAEINSKKQAEPEKKDVLTEADKDEELSQDQQTALNQIMAEIESKKKTDASNIDAQDTNPEAQKETLSDDQQSALDQIMAEIGNRKKSVLSPNDDSDRQPDETQPDQGLSFDELNNELSQLLVSQKDQQGSAGDMEPDTSLVSDNENNASQSAGVESFEKSATGVSENSDLAGDRPIDEKSEFSKDFPVLKEIGPDNTGPKASPPKKNKPLLSLSKNKTPSGKRWRLTSAAIAMIVLISVAYWGYTALDRQNHNLLLEPQPPEGPSSARPIVSEKGQPGSQVSLSVKGHPDPLEQPGYDKKPMLLLASLLSSGRNQVQSKITEIEELVRYYQNGIEEERQFLKTILAQERYRSFDQAKDNPRFLLSLQAFQRRTAYIEKLKIPLEQLRLAYEELLFLERKSHLYALLSDHASGVLFSDFEYDATLMLKAHLDHSQQLRLDEIDGAKPSLTSIWDQLRERSTGNDTTKSATPSVDPLSEAIANEICNGDFSRRYLVTGLSDKTATCLLNWHGKDLFLNEIKELPPSVAKILAQWPGEWLSLNGIKELSPETAQYLSAWTGKRLSLNGLVRLSPQATVNLSHWKGEQIEMVSLVDIGPWKNYGTRLFLSEQLKQRLERH